MKTARKILLTIALITVCVVILSLAMQLLLHLTGFSIMTSQPVDRDALIHRVGIGRTASEFVCPDGYGFSLVFGAPTTTPVGTVSTSRVILRNSRSEVILSNAFEYSELPLCNWLEDHGLDGRFLPPEVSNLYEGGLVPGHTYEIETVVDDSPPATNISVWLVFLYDSMEPGWPAE